MAWYVDLPDPREDRWVNVAAFETRAEALAYAADTFGADEEGLVGVVVPSDDDFIVDLPDPENPGGPWIHMRTLRSMEDAVKFLEDWIGHHEGDGRIRMVFEVPDEDEPKPGPKDWSPRRKK